MSVRDVYEIAQAILLSVGAGGAIVLALSSWLGKVWANRILESERAKHSRDLERLKGDLERHLHSAKAAFDAEFEIYRGVWSAASKLRTMTFSLRSGLTVRGLGEEQEVARFRQFQEALGSFEAFVDSHKPFFAPEIYDALVTLQAHASAENKRAIANRELQGIGRGKDHMEGVVPVIEACEKVCKLIRQRLYATTTPNNTLQPTASGGG